MLVIKYIMLILLFLATTKLGQLLSQKFVYRLEELEDMENALNMFKAKIKFTYSPIPEIFQEITKSIGTNVSNIFIKATEKMKFLSAEDAWINSVEELKNNTNFNEEDIKTIKLLGKMLGLTDAQGQISQIEITQNFLEKQIQEAYEDKQKNQKLYKKLCSCLGLGLVVLLI